MVAKSKVQYYCVAVRRNYETMWRVIGKYDTQEAAQAALDEKRAYAGSFNYDNAELRILSRAEAKQEFGAAWEYHPIGEKPPVERTPRKTSKAQ
ncbi:MAG: hypothetical protein ABI947_10755 [Chloroflexota bacterium]